MNRKITSAIIAITILALAGCSGPSESTGKQTDTKMESSTQAKTEDTKKLTPYTLEEIAAHGTKDDCWMTIKGKVYDVTNAFARHPGGEAMLLGCGKEATGLFENRPLEKGSHSAKAYEGLQNFLIGELKS